MRSMLLALALLTACTEPEATDEGAAETLPKEVTDASPQAALMDEIEALVRLPEGARALEDYARYYAFGPGSEIVGIYTLPFARPEDGGCAETADNAALPPPPCPEEDAEPALADGQRRWLDDSDDLPVIVDGGCSVITIRYDSRTGALAPPACNGGA